MRRLLTGIAALAPLLFVLTAPAGAQRSELQPGTRVRISAPGIVAGEFTGTVISATADTLVVASPQSSQVRVPLSQLTSMKVSRGKSRADGAVRGLWWGVPIGLAFGLSVPYGSDCPFGDACVDNDDQQLQWVLASTLAGAFYGAGIGAIVGRERWETLQVNARPAIGVRNGRPTVSLALSF